MSDIIYSIEIGNELEFTLLCNLLERLDFHSFDSLEYYCNYTDKIVKTIIIYENGEFITSPEISDNSITFNDLLEIWE